MDARTFADLPIAALRSRGGTVIEANAAFVTMSGIAAEHVVGRPFDELLHVTGGDPGDRGTWCRMLDVFGRMRSLRVLFTDDGDVRIAYLLDDDGAHDARAAAEALARAGTELGGARNEAEVLERAADALSARGYTATFLLIVPGDPLLVYGPTRLAHGGSLHPSIQNERVPCAVLYKLNPRFMEGRAAFLPSFDAAADAAFSSANAEPLKARRPGKHVLQTPVFVSGEPYGAFVLTSDAISPALAGPAEIFATVVARTIENLRMQADLVERERLAAIGEAAAVMAHEVRNPVAALLNAVTLLRKCEGDQGELLDIIGEESRSLDRIVTHLLALGRPITPRIVAGDLCRPAGRAVAAARAQFPGASIVLHETPASASMDSDLVQIAVLNLLRNALEASPPGAPVHVWVEDHVTPCIRVDDQGPGIPSTLVSRVFEPFFTTRPAGTGIGLAAVRRIVEACGGTVSIASSDAGGGRVILSFPRTTRTSAPPLRAP